MTFQNEESYKIKEKKNTSAAAFQVFMTVSGSQFPQQPAAFPMIPFSVLFPQIYLFSGLLGYIFFCLPRYIIPVSRD